MLGELLEHEPPLVVKLPRQAGRKEQRYAHLFAGPPEIAESDTAPPPEAARQKVAAEDERIRQLEEDVAALKAEFEAFRKQFE